MEHLVSEWGYLVVFLGSLIEGESIILPAGYYAAQGVLELKKIILIAFVGTLIADQSLYMVGQLWGQKILSYFPRLKAPSQKVFSFLHEYGSFYILTFRFIYGVRIISPVIIGTAGIPFMRFAVLNLVAAAIWSVVSCGAGYLFGGFLLHYLSPLQRFLLLGSLGAAALCWLLWKGYLFCKKEIL